MDGGPGIEPVPRRPAGTWRVVLISAVVNLGLLVTYEAAQRGTLSFDRLLHFASLHAQDGKSPARSALQAEAPAKGDLSANLPPRKESLRLTIATHSAATGFAPDKGDKPEAILASESGPETPAETDMSQLSSVENQALAPMLLKDPQTGKLRIGQFKSMTIEGSSDECLDMAHSMLEDIGADGDLLDVMAASSSITIARICAANGNVMFTCRNNSIVISPRHSRPDDNCLPT